MRIHIWWRSEADGLVDGILVVVMDLTFCWKGYYNLQLNTIVANIPTLHYLPGGGCLGLVGKV